MWIPLVLETVHCVTIIGQDGLTMVTRLPWYVVLKVITNALVDEVVHRSGMKRLGFFGIVYVMSLIEETYHTSISQYKRLSLNIF